MNNDKWRQKLHLEPQKGWLNDPNGLCYFKGKYHVFFQYSPDSPLGEGRKCWGHYESPDLLNWEFTGTVLYPDTPYDKDGVFSGSAICTDDTMHLFYTGNVMEDGDHDYVTSGRGANVLHVTTKDGKVMSGKKLVLENKDYPSYCSCHVRDPKIYSEQGKYKMVLGARTLEDKGCVMIYSSDDLENWVFEEKITTENFGFMWECPDLFEISGRKFLSLSPQGVPHQKVIFQNVYSSGYFKFSEDSLGRYTEWDCGFDWYAPQTFETPDGRRIIIGWMGIGDIPYSNPTVALGWQHCLTLPREVRVNEHGTLSQLPCTEINSLREDKIIIADGSCEKFKLPFDLTAEVSGKYEIIIDKDIVLHYENGLFELKFLGMVGFGRDIRYAEMDNCNDIRIIADTSSLEIYLDKGRKVLSTRFYPDSKEVSVLVRGLSAQIYPMRAMNITLRDE